MGTRKASNRKASNRIGNFEPLTNKDRRYQALSLAKGWTKHHPLQENPMDGEPCDNRAVWSLFIDNNRPPVAFINHLRKTVVVKHPWKDGVWYECAASELMRLDRLASERMSNEIIKNNNRVRQDNSQPEKELRK